jgi:hypothetical protein
MISTMWPFQINVRLGRPKGVYQARVQPGPRHVQFVCRPDLKNLASGSILANRKMSISAGLPVRFVQINYSS